MYIHTHTRMYLLYNHTHSCLGQQSAYHDRTLKEIEGRVYMMCVYIYIYIHT